MDYSTSSETVGSNELVIEEEPYREDRKYDYDKFQKVRWVTGEMGKMFQRDLFLIVHAKETVFYILFVICVTVAAVGIVDDKMFFMSQSLRVHLKDQAGYLNPSLETTSGGKFDDISTLEDMWEFIEEHLVKYLHAQSFVGELVVPEADNQTDFNATNSNMTATEDDEKEEKEQKARDRDFATTPPKRKKREDEKSKSAKNDTLDEDDSHGENNTDTDAIEAEYTFDRGLGHENILVGRAVIRTVMVNETDCEKPFASIFLKCYPPYSPEKRRTTKFEQYDHQSDRETQAEGFKGKISHYLGDGFQEKLGPTFLDSVKTIQRLRNERYVTKGTRALFIDATYYNPSVNLFCAVKFLFEMPAGGGVFPSAYFYAFQLTRVTVGGYVTIAFEVIFLLFIVFYLVEDIRSISFVKFAYFCSFWNWVNIAIYMTSICYLSYIIIQWDAARYLMVHLKKDLNEYISFQTMTKNEQVMRNCLSAVVFLVYLKIFKYMSFNWTLAILNKTIEKCLADVFAFTIMFLIMFIAFALFGSLCFGTQMIHFSSITLAMFALLRTMLGDFDYQEYQDAGADKFVAETFYLIYLLLVILILLNMFLAIINDTYSDAKTDLAIAVPERRVAEFWYTGLYNLLGACGCAACAPKILIADSHALPAIDEIRAALKRCGYSDLDIDLFIGRYNVDPDAQIRSRDVSKLLQQVRAEGPKRYYPKSGTHKGTEQPAIIALDDFSQQQHRLGKVEAVMKILSGKLDELLTRLNEVESLPKERD